MTTDHETTWNLLSKQGVKVRLPGENGWDIVATFKAYSMTDNHPGFAHLEGFEFVRASDGSAGAEHLTTEALDTQAKIEQAYQDGWNECAEALADGPGVGTKVGDAATRSAHAPEARLPNPTHASALPDAVEDRGCVPELENKLRCRTHDAAWPSDRGFCVATDGPETPSHSPNEPCAQCGHTFFHHVFGACDVSRGGERVDDCEGFVPSGMPPGSLATGDVGTELPTCPKCHTWYGVGGCRHTPSAGAGTCEPSAAILGRGEPSHEGTTVAEPLSPANPALPTVGCDTPGCTNGAKHLWAPGDGTETYVCEQHAGPEGPVVHDVETPVSPYESGRLACGARHMVDGYVSECHREAMHDGPHESVTRLGHEQRWTTGVGSAVPDPWRKLAERARLLVKWAIRESREGTTVHAAATGWLKAYLDAKAATDSQERAT